MCVYIPPWQRNDYRNWLYEKSTLLDGFFSVALKAYTVALCIPCGYYPCLPSYYTLNSHSLEKNKQNIFQKHTEQKQNVITVLPSRSNPYCSNATNPPCFTMFDSQIPIISPLWCCISFCWFHPCFLMRWCWCCCCCCCWWWWWWWWNHHLCIFVYIFAA